MELCEDEHDPQIAHNSLFLVGDRVGTGFGVLALVEQYSLRPRLGELRLFDHQQFADVAALGQSDLPRFVHRGRSRVVKLAIASASRRQRGDTTASGAPLEPSESPACTDGTT